MALFRGQYRVESARLPGYDYATRGAYFVTICTKHRQYFFGNIENNQVQYAEAGAIAANLWERLPGQFPYVELAEYIIMPNHVHGIIWLLPPDGRDANSRISADEPRAILPPGGRDAINRVSTNEQEPRLPTQDRVPTNEQGLRSSPSNRISGDARHRCASPLSDVPAGTDDSLAAGASLSQIIRWFKGRSTFEIRKSGLGNFAWQPRFYDHIIRDENSLSQIRTYIRQNPQDWLNDDLR